MFKLTDSNRKWWILVAMTSSISMTFIDVTVLPVALPTIQRQLLFSEIGLQWIVNAYTLFLTIFLLAGGRISDRISHRKGFCTGLLLFVGASILCGLSFSEWWFIASRCLQGLGGSILIPSSSAIIFNSFPHHQRGKALGLYVSIGSIFLAIGPLIGGIFTQYFTWRLVFWINIPIALIGLLLTLYSVPKTKGVRHEFDWIGFFTFSVGISAIIVAIMQAKLWGWLSVATLGPIAFGLILLFFLWKTDRAIKDPYIDFSLFRNRVFLGANASIFCAQFLLMVTVFWAIYFQNVLGFTPTKAGAISLLANIPVMVAAPLGGHLLDRKGPRLPIICGFLLIALSLFWFLQNIENRNVWLLLTAVVPFGFGVPLIFAPSMVTAMGEIETTRRGLAAATTGMLRHLGGTLGLAIIGTLFLHVQFGQFSSDLKRNTVTENLSPLEFQGLLSSSPAAIKRLHSLPELSQDFVKQSYLHSYVKAFGWINSLAIVFALLGFTLAIILIKKKKKTVFEL